MLVGAFILGTALNTLASTSSDVRGLLGNVEVRSVKHLHDRMYVRLVADHSLCASDYLGFHAFVGDQENDLVGALVRARMTRAKLNLIVTDMGDCDSPDTLLRIEGVSDD